MFLQTLYQIVHKHYLGKFKYHVEHAYVPTYDLKSIHGKFVVPDMVIFYKEHDTIEYMDSYISNIFAIFKAI